MPAHEALPAPVRAAGRGAYRQLTALTAPLRLTPGFLMIGVSRCGTTSMFRALAAHPQVVRPAHRKGIYYFDLNYHRGPAWYRGHFPAAVTARRRTAGYGEPVAFEASGYYIFHPLALERIAHDLPGVKLVVMLRDPVERAFSAYKHERAGGFEPAGSFEKALELEDARLAGEVGKIRLDPRYESFSHRHHAYRRRGHYAEQLDRLFGLFPREQVHIVESAAYFAEPAREYGRVQSFLGLHLVPPPAFTRPKAHPSAAMSATTRAMLRDYFAAHDERLTRWLGHPPGWRR